MCGVECRKLLYFAPNNRTMTQKIRRLPIPLTSLFLLVVCLLACTGTPPPENAANPNNKPVSTAPTPPPPTYLSNATRVDKNIRSIYQDKKGTYWFGTNGAGVFRYDKKSLVQYTVKDGLADNQVVSIQEDEAGNIWLESAGFAISKFDGTTFTAYTNNPDFTIETTHNWNAALGDLWFFAGAGVFRYRSSALTYLPFPRTTKTPKNTDKTAFTLSPSAVYTTLRDQKGQIWMGTQARGVCRYDGKNHTWFTEKGLAGPAVLALLEDSKGTIWMGNNGAGLFRYDGRTLVNVTEEHQLGNADFRATGKSGLNTLARVYTINEDNSGAIWVGTADAGVWRYYEGVLTNYTTKDGLPSNAVSAICQDNNGELWFGTDAHGLCTFNGSTFTEVVDFVVAGR